MKPTESKAAGHRRVWAFVRGSIDLVIQPAAVPLAQLGVGWHPRKGQAA